ncbi:gypsy/ty3 retroelement polyprotein [Tanacetum coccineum]
MVNTRTNPDTTTIDITNTLTAIQTAIEQINGNITGLLLFQQFATGELNRLNGGEGTNNRGGSGSQYGRLTKFEFPKFYGEDVQGWLYRVNQFFLLDSIADEQKVRLVSMHMFDKALNWHKQFIRKHGDNVAWAVYEREVQNRFDSVFEDPMVELKNLKHVTTVQLYQEQFEALMNKVELSEAYAVSLFIGGLKDEIGMHVRMFKPNTLSDVYCLAKMQEATLQAIKTRQTPLLTTPRTPYAATTSYANKTVSYPPKSTTTTLALPAPNTISKPAYVQPRKQLTQKEIADKRAKNLCFYCDEKFVPGHKCSGQLFLLEICADKSTSEEYELEALLEDPVVQNFGESITDTPVISLHAMTGESTYKTMKVKAYVGKHTVHSLIDSGSTHIFLDLKVAKKLGCKLKATCPMDVSVANGQVMSSLYECKGFTWTLQGVEFTSDVFILPLGGCELVLGVQWLSVLGDIKWNFKDLVMDFVYNGRRMVLRGTQKAALQWMNGKRQSKATSNGQVLCVYPNTLFSMTQTTTSPPCSQITDLLDSYQDVFVTPTSLPPKRKQDHIIPLVPNTPPINIRPYKHPPNQKDDVEAMVQELMESGAIRDSQSPYSSPIVMVKKKDGTWRMCVDYRQLNKYTIKDKFLIPVVEELLDELSGANIISNLIEVRFLPNSTSSAAIDEASFTAHIVPLMTIHVLPLLPHQLHILPFKPLQSNLS